MTVGGEHWPTAGSRGHRPCWYRHMFRSFLNPLRKAQFCRPPGCAPQGRADRPTRRPHLAGLSPHVRLHGDQGVPARSGLCPRGLLATLLFFQNTFYQRPVEAE